MFQYLRMRLYKIIFESFVQFSKNLFYFGAYNYAILITLFFGKERDCLLNLNEPKQVPLFKGCSEKRIPC